MSSIKGWIEAQADGEEVEGVVLARMGGYYDEDDDPSEDYNAPEDPNYPLCPFGKLLSWADAQPFVQYDFHAGYGSAGCQPFTAWTKSWVIGVSQYGGSTRPFRLPRHPIAFDPPMPGGG